MNDYLIVLIVLFAFYFIMFIIGQKLKNNSVVDIGWGFSFVLTAVFTLLYFRTFALRQILVTLLVMLWGLRLTYHLYRRNHRKPEDYRYQEFRRKWGSKYVLLKAFLHVYLLQMVLSFIISIAFIYVNLNSNIDLTWLDLVGMLVWIIGFYFEVVADRQLKNFLSNPDNKGKILSSGLYQYTRHPNYFGEALMWWGIFLIALNLGNWWLIISPITITYLVRFVSGVPMLEKAFEDNQEFLEYARTTNIFIPWFKKAKKDSNL